MNRIKTVRMNYKADEKTEIGRMYTREELQNAFDKLLERIEVPVVRNSSELYQKNDNGHYVPIVCFKDIIGFFRGYEIKEDGEINIKILPIIETSLFDGNFSVSTGIIGILNEDSSVKIESIVGFFIAGNIDLINSDGKKIDKVDKEPQELIILTGNIGCGKSTFARELVTNNKDCIVVNDDAISTMIGGGDYTNYDESKKYLYKCIELYCVELGLGTNRSVVVDMPNVKRSSRRGLIDIGKRYDVNIISYDWGSGNLGDLDRRKKEARGYSNWDDAYTRKRREYEKPSKDEGFNKIIRIETNNE